MYAEFYNLTGLPFQLTPDSRFFYESSVHSKAMSHLIYGLNQAEGFIVITGDVGAGKTTLVDYLCSTLDPERYVIARMLTTQTSADDTLRLAAAGFGITTDGLGKGELLQLFEATLVANFNAGRRSLLLVDEAQNLTVPAIEELRMLSNFVIRHETPMQGFLLGQPQFRKTMARPELEQLRQRVLASYHLGPMAEAETRAYIEHRLRLVGWNDDPRFTDEAFRQIYIETGGIPRKINSLCSRLMLFGFLEETHRVDQDTVAQVAEELRAEIGGGDEQLNFHQAAARQHNVGLNGGSESDLREPDLLQSDIRPPDLRQIEGRLSRIEQRIDKSDQAIKRALAVIARRFDGSYS
jgi:putative secretion ATPase (PEP-CTERM system associated)